MSSVRGQYDIKAIQASLLKLSNNTALREKILPFVDPQYFWHAHDKIPEVQAVRRIMTVLLDLHEREKKEKNFPVSIHSVRSGIVSSRQDEFTETSIHMYDNILSSEELLKMSEDDGIWQIFLDYLKMNQLYKSGKAFESHYNRGDLERAASEMRSGLSSIERLKHDPHEALNPFEYENLLFEGDDTDSRRLYLGPEKMDVDIDGFYPQSLNLFIAKTGGGKSMMVQHILNKAIDEKRPVDVVIVEDPKKLFVRRLYSCRTGIEMSRLKKVPFKDLTDNERASIRDAAKEINEYAKITFMYGQSVSAVHQKKMENDAERKYKGLKPYVIDIVDYTGHIAKYSDGETEHGKFRNAFAERKNYALSHNKICFDFAQLNRTGSKSLSENKIVNINDLATGFDIAQVCDVIVSLNRTTMDIKQNTSTMAVCKAKDGGEGEKYTVSVDFARARYLMSQHSNLNLKPNI